jgi:hypothetical protein
VGTHSGLTESVRKMPMCMRDFSIFARSRSIDR